MKKKVKISKQTLLESWAVYRTSNGWQWEESFQGTEMECMRIARAFMNEGYDLQLDEFTQAYIEAALWSSTDQNEEPLDKHYTVDNISTPMLLNIIRDCRDFQAAHEADIAEDLKQAGYDFWLTRNGHGAGFWDGEWPEDVGQRLTEASKAYGSFYLMPGSDGMIY